MRTRTVTALGAVLAAAVLIPLSVRIEPTPPKARPGTAGAAIPADQTSFDPDRTVREMWGARVLPYLEAKAGPFADVRREIASDPDAAGRKFGHRQEAEGAPWTIVTKAEGRIVAANTASRAATVDVDTDGDGKADLAVQIGPVIKGTALRDALDFVSFGSFTNQIDYARLAKSMNAYVDDTVLSKLPRDGLAGRKVALLGAFTLERPDRPPVVTPAELTLGDASP